MSGKIVPWTEHDLLFCLVNALEQSGAKLNYDSIGYPAGRNANGFMQKLNALKRAWKAEMDALNSGKPVPEAAATPKKGAGRKRKAKGDENESSEDATLKKRKYTKKTASEPVIKSEPEVEAEAEKED